MPAGVSRNLIEIIIASKNEAEGDLGNATQQVKKLGKEILVAGAAIQGAGAVIVGSMIAVTKQTAAAADQFAKFERATGIASKTLAGLQFAVKRWGGSARDVDTALRRLTNAVADASSGLETYQRAFRRVGISTDDLVGSDGALIRVDKLLPVLANKFQNMTDSVTKAAVAQELLGRGGLRLIPLLNQGAAGIDKMNARAERLGIVLSKSAIAQAESFQDALLDLEESVKGVKFALGEQLMPAFTVIMNRMVDIVVGIKDWIRLHPTLAAGITRVGAALFAGGGIILGVGILIKLLPILSGLLVTAFSATGPAALAVIGISIIVGKLVAKFVDLDVAVKDVLATGSRAVIFRNMEDTQSEINKLTDSLKETKKEIKEIEDTPIFLRGRHAGTELSQLKQKVTDLTLEIIGAVDRFNEFEGAIEKMDVTKVIELAAALDQVTDAQFRLDVLQGRATMEDQYKRNAEQVELTSLKIEKLKKQALLVNTSDERRRLILVEITSLTEKLIQLQQEFNQLKAEEDEAARARAELLQELFEERMKQIEEVKEAQLKATQALANQMSGPLSAAFNSFFQGVTTGTKSFTEAFKAAFRSLTASVLSMLAQMLAKVIALRIAMAFLSGGTSEILAVGAPVVLKSFSNRAASGGVIGGSGRGGVDNVPILAQRGESVLDTETTDMMKEQLEGGSLGGGTHITVNTGFATFSQQEAIRFGREITEEVSKFGNLTARGRR